MAGGTVAVPAGNAEEAALADSIEALAAVTVGEFGHRCVLFLDEAHELPSTPPPGGGLQTLAARRGGMA